ncbi:hypothetical protein CTAYLR_007328 [Chrysophaeum taylorii]|uniref:CYTH domain-containing protein n=1 Tax=Chrysophaeum taylorii TaxID=2483200 RepID=A0AAD7UJX7_9STRA|nr:hypothetical protein CTAYLR_007328 [Chrysophaeum taylorii]
MSVIEVEAKFQAQDVREAILANGGRVLGEVSFEDTYYDTKECALTTQDRWLRRRDDAWELKVPVAETKRSGGERTVFREIEGAEPVAAELRRLYPNLFSIDARCSEAALEAAGCAAFAQFRTTRGKFEIRGCRLDLDHASFGHSVLEIEAVVQTPEEVPAAERKIREVADLVGAKPLQHNSGGKLETYIRRHVPHVLEALVAAGVLKEEEEPDDYT